MSQKPPNPGQNPPRPSQNPRPSQPQPAGVHSPVGQPEVPGQNPDVPQPLPYGQHLLPKGPTGPSRQSIKSSLGVPGMMSIIYSSLYGVILVAGIGLLVLMFIGGAAVLEQQKNVGPRSSGSKGAAAKQKQKMRAKEKEAIEQEYEKNRTLLFMGFGILSFATFCGLTGQVAGIVAGYNMSRLISYKWAFIGSMFAAFPFCTLFYLILYLVDLSAGGFGATIIFVIGYGVADTIRFLLSFWNVLMLWPATTKAAFDVR